MYEQILVFAGTGALNAFAGYAKNTDKFTLERAASTIVIGAAAGAITFGMGINIENIGSVYQFPIGLVLTHFADKLVKGFYARIRAVLGIK